MFEFMLPCGIIESARLNLILQRTDLTLQRLLRHRPSRDQMSLQFIELLQQVINIFAMFTNHEQFIASRMQNWTMHESQKQHLSLLLFTATSSSSSNECRHTLQIIRQMNTFQRPFTGCQIRFLFFLLLVSVGVDGSQQLRTRLNMLHLHTANIEPPRCMQRNTLRIVTHQYRQCTRLRFTRNWRYRWTLHERLQCVAIGVNLVSKIGTRWFRHRRDARQEFIRLIGHIQQGTQ
mmetsp:Transcript_23235/g.37227  ORF Transcript_23235/g.37227 Transcript_23235/m.37227 type:complete len:234 (-) Transcript_23235:41-742(-)